MIRFQSIPFPSLTAEQVHDFMKLRCDVFILEQNCVYADIDGKDPLAIHILGYVGKELAAYARVLPQNTTFAEVSIGRVATAPKHRGKSYGKALMEEAMMTAFRDFKTNEILISAQLYLEKFYQTLGFRSEGESYLEDEIPHIKMRLKK